MIIGDMEIRLRADIARLQRDMDQARQVVGGAMANISRAVSGAMAAVAALGVGLSVAAFAGWVKAAIDAADATDELAEKTGIAHKELAGLQLIFEREGVGGDAMVASLTKLQKAVVEGNAGLSAMGIKTKETSGAFRSAQDVLYDVADQFAQMDNGAQKTALALEVFGKSGASLIPMLNGGSDGMREMAEMAQKLGLVIDEKTAKSAGDFNDTIFLLQQGSQGVARGLAAELLPTLTNLAGAFLKSMTEGQALARTGQVISVALKGLYTIGGIVAETFKTVGTVIGALAAGITNNLTGAVDVLIKVANGEFKAAWNSMKQTALGTAGVYIDAAQDIGSSWKATGANIAQAWKEEGDAAVLATAKMAKAQQDLLANQKQREEAEKKAAAAREAAGKTAEQFILTQQKEIAQVGLTADQVKRLAADFAAAAAPTEALRLKIMEQALALDIATKAHAEKTAAEAAATAATVKADEALYAATASVWDQVEAMRKQVDLFGLTEEQVLRLQRTKLEADLAAADGDEKKIAALNLQIEGMSRLIELAGQKTFLEESKKAADEAEKVQKSLWESIDKTAHDTFVSIMDGSKSAAQRLKDTFKNVFFDWLYSMTLKKWIVNLQGQFSTSGAGAVASLAGGGEGGGIGGIGGLLSAAKTGYTALSNGISGMVGMFSEGLHQFGATITSNVAALGEWMGGSVGEMLGSNALAIGNAGIWAGGIGAGLGAGKLISNGYSVAGNSGNGAVMLGTALGAIWGPLGSALGGAIGGLVNRAFGMGAKEVTGTTIQGNLGGQGFDGSFQDQWKQKGGWFRSDKSGTTTRAIDEATATGLGDAYSKITMASRDYAKALGVDADYITNRSQSVSIALGKDQAANEKAISDFFTGVANTIAGELVPGIDTLSKEGEAASATLERLAVQYTTIDATLRALGVSGESAFGAVGVATLVAREKLLALTGGLDSFVSQASYFAQNYLTEAERLAPVQEQVAEKMAELGLAGVDTAAEFRDAVLGLTKSGALATESGANLYAELMKIAPAFKVVADANAAAAKAQAEAAQAQEEAAKKALEDAAAIAQKLADINKPYQDRIAELQVELGYASAARVVEIEAMDASTRSLYEHEQGLLAEKAARDKRNAEYDAYVAKAAQDEQARQAQAAAIAQQRATMEIQLYNLTHTAAEQTAAARERELASIDPVLKGLQQQIYAQQDLADAAAIAAKAIEDAAARAKAIASERAGIERSILQLQGNTAELRKLELAVMDPANRALQESYYALQDKMAAEQAAAAQAQAIAQAQAQAAEEARRAEDALKQARQAATDSIFDEVKRIRGLIDGGGATSLAGAQSAFAIATAQARAGDLDAMNALPGLSKTLLDLAEQSAVSLLDLRRIQAQTAGSLQMTGTSSVSQYGLTVPKFDVGTNQITRTGLAIVHQGEEIVPAASNGPYRSSGTDMNAVLAELRALREEVTSFHRDNSNENRGIARDSKRVADGLEQVTDGFDAMRTREEA